MVMFPVVALALSAIFEGLEIDATVIAGTLLVLAGNVFVISTKVRRGRNLVRVRAGVLPTTARMMDVE
jgi:drug/metabolite transporter (DMT)-like permease